METTDGMSRWLGRMWYVVCYRVSFNRWSTHGVVQFGWIDTAVCDGIGSALTLEEGMMRHGSGC